MSENTNCFIGRLAIQQRVLPAYRGAFFDTLANACTRGLSVFAGKPLPDEQIVTTDHLAVATYYPARNQHFLNVGSAFYQCRQEGMIEWLGNWQPDALIVEANPRYPSTPAAVHWMHARGYPVLGWGLGAPQIRGLLKNYRHWKRRSFLKILDGVIAYSQRGAEEYRSFGFPPERVFVAPNAMLGRPETPPPDRAPVFPNRAVILFVGRLQRRKRIDNLLRACAALPEKLQPQLWVIGDGPAREDFQSLAREIYPQAEFIGALYGEELEEYFNAADLFVLPGTGGLAVQQAMAFGLPVIVAEGDGTQDDFITSKNGWIIPSDDLQALTSTLHTALNDLPKLREMGRESYRIVAQEANIEAMVDVFLKALTTAVK